MDRICCKDAFLQQRTSIIILGIDGTLFFDFIARTAPRMMPPMHRRMQRQVGMLNLFLRNHGRLNAIEIQIKNIVNKI